jgi:hypothetical protein
VAHVPYGAAVVRDFLLDSPLSLEESIDVVRRCYHDGGRLQDMRQLLAEGMTYADITHCFEIRTAYNADTKEIVYREMDEDLTCPMPVFPHHVSYKSLIFLSKFDSDEVDTDVMEHYLQQVTDRIEATGSSVGLGIALNRMREIAEREQINDFESLLYRAINVLPFPEGTYRER